MPARDGYSAQQASVPYTRAMLYEGLPAHNVALLDELMGNVLATASMTKVDIAFEKYWKPIAEAYGWPEIIETDDPERGGKLVTFVAGPEVRNLAQVQKGDIVTMAYIEAVAAKLRSFGIDVDLVLDTNRAALVKALADYHDRAAGYDVNVLFYAGHGVQMGGINYIVPVDLPAAGATVGSVKLNAVSLNDALEYLPARTRLVFLDACRDNPLSRSLMATRSAALGLAPVSTVSGTLVAYATKDGSTAEDGSGRNSPYTAALLEHLDLEEDIAVVLRRVRQSVLKATNQRQEPWEYGSLIGDQLVLSRLAR
jgi:hypothetical protein